MKSRSICAGALIAAASLASAQSPAATESKTIGGKKIEIKYSSPRVNNRADKIFTKDGLIGNDQTYPVWRAGANAATAFHTDADLNVGGLAVPKGDYTLFVDVGDQKNWQLVVSKPPAPIENLKYTIADAGGNKGKLQLEWENHIASVQFTVK